MKKLLYILPALAILFTACSKKVTDPVTPSNGTTATPNNIVEQINANRNESEVITGRLSLGLSAGKQKIDVGGNIKMKRNESIQISLQVFGLVEAGRIELTPDYFLILNRIGKQYVKASYKDIAFFKDNNIDFYTMQAIFWNELFTVSEKNSQKTPLASDFVQSQQGDNVVLTQTTKQLVIRFITNTAAKTLQQTTITPNNGGNMKCDYKSWVRLGRKDFPDKFDLGISVSNTPINASFSLSRLHNDDTWVDTRTNIDKKKLKEVTLEQAFKQIMSLAN